MCLQVVLEQGGIQPGGLNFDAKLRRESTDVVDMFIAHIGKVADRQTDTETQAYACSLVSPWFYAQVDG